MNNRRIILPNEMKEPKSFFNSQTRIKQIGKQPAEVQVPIFPIQVRSNESFLIYALCLRVVETGVYTDMPLISAHLEAMKTGMEMVYQKLGIPMFEYRKFVTLSTDLQKSDDSEKGEEKNGFESRLDEKKE